MRQMLAHSLADNRALAAENRALHERVQVAPAARATRAPASLPPAATDVLDEGALMLQDEEEAAAAAAAADEAATPKRRQEGVISTSPEKPPKRTVPEVAGRHAC